MKQADYIGFDAVGLAELVARGAVRAEELVAAAYGRMDEVNDRLNAVIFRFDEAPKQASGLAPSGPFGGVPFLVKNLDAAVAGQPLTMGSRALRDHVAPLDSEFVLRLRQSGLILIGSTNSPELGLLPTTEPEAHGPTRNPWSLDHSAGGSSGGSAAAVAAGIVPAAHASDGGGSIRIPASACGVFGLKPTRGRMPLGPEMSDGWNGLVVPHAISRSVRDSAALLDATQGSDVGAPYVAPAPQRPFREELERSPGKLRIAFATRSLLGEQTHADCIEAGKDAARLLTDLGHEVEEAKIEIDREELRLAYLTVVAACTAAAIESISQMIGRAPSPRLFEASSWFLRQVGLSLSAAEYEQARSIIGRISRRIGKFFCAYDVLMTPTMAYPPVRIGELALKPAERLGLAALRAAGPKFVLRRVLSELAARMFEKTANTMLFNMTGQPAMSVPLFWNRQGLPIGMQFAGRFGDEATLFRLAAQIEEARPWSHRRPPL